MVNNWLKRRVYRLDAEHDLPETATIRSDRKLELSLKSANY